MTSPRPRPATGPQTAPAGTATAIGDAVRCLGHGSCHRLLWWPNLCRLGSAPGWTRMYVPVWDLVWEVRRGGVFLRGMVLVIGFWMQRSALMVSTVAVATVGLVLGAGAAWASPSAAAEASTAKVDCLASTHRDQVRGRRSRLRDHSGGRPTYIGGQFTSVDRGRREPTSPPSAPTEPSTRPGTPRPTASSTRWPRRPTAARSSSVAPSPPWEGQPRPARGGHPRHRRSGPRLEDDGEQQRRPCPRRPTPATGSTSAATSAGSAGRPSPGWPRSARARAPSTPVSSPAPTARSAPWHFPTTASSCMPAGLQRHRGCGPARRGRADRAAGAATSFAPTDGGVVISMDIAPTAGCSSAPPPTARGPTTRPTGHAGVPHPHRRRRPGDPRHGRRGLHRRTLQHPSRGQARRLALASFLPGDGTATAWNPGATGPFGVWALGLTSTPLSPDEPAALSIGGDFTRVAGLADAATPGSPSRSPAHRAGWQRSGEACLTPTRQLPSPPGRGTGRAARQAAIGRRHSARGLTGSACRLQRLGELVRRRAEPVEPRLTAVSPATRAVSGTRSPRALKQTRARSGSGSPAPCRDPCRIIAWGDQSHGGWPCRPYWFSSARRC